jgi:phage protein D
MAKTKAPEKTPAEIRREAANAVADERRARERDQHQANADKQRRFRESMKAQGMKQILYPGTP